MLKLIVSKTFCSIAHYIWIFYTIILIIYQKILTKLFSDLYLANFYILIKSLFPCIYHLMNIRKFWKNYVWILKSIIVLF